MGPWADCASLPGGESAEKAGPPSVCMLTHRCPGLLSPMIVDCILTEGSFSSIFIFSLYMLLILPLISI